MAINRIEIQDAEGNIYHPHSTSDVIFHGDRTAKDLFEEFLKFLESGGTIGGELKVSEIATNGNGLHLKGKANTVLLTEDGSHFRPNTVSNGIISLGANEFKFKDLFLNLIESQSSVTTILNNFIKSGLLYNKLRFNTADGNGAALFKESQSAIYFHVAIDIGRPSAYLIGIGSRHLGGTHRTQVLHANILSYGASNSQGTQVINGAASDVVLQFVICAEVY